mgnify:CR=1 FL=1
MTYAKMGLDYYTVVFGVETMKKTNERYIFAYLNNISKSFGKVNALKDVSIEIYKNNITAIVGDNGSGKSTLIKILSGSLKPDTGNIYIEGKHYKYLTPKLAYENGIATVYQDLSLDNYRDVAGNIFLGKEITRFGFIIDYKEMNRQTELFLNSLDINIPYLRTPVGYLSGGQRQSVAIARAIYQGRNLIIFDEPTAAMGVKESKATNRLIKSLPEKGFTVLVVSHDMHQIFDIADRILIMRNGEIIEDVMKSETTPMELIERISGE